MVLESILSPEGVIENPIEMIIFGFIIASVGILLSLWVFPSYASFAMITFSVMAVLPLMVKIIKKEKEKQEKIKNLRITAHTKVIYSLLFLFLGFLIAYTLWYLLLPTQIANNLFFIQINTITEINTPSTAVLSNINSPSTAVLSNMQFIRILLNNLRVLALSFLFSFIFCSGAIFILAWNASVLGVGLANSIKISIAAQGSGSAAYFSAFSFALLRYLIHGIPEITSYFLGGLAGGIVSFAILDYKLGIKTFYKKFPRLAKDATLLIIGAIILLIIAALIEIYIISIFT